MRITKGFFAPWAASAIPIMILVCKYFGHMQGDQPL